MDKRKWKKTDTKILKPHHFPWGVLGTLFIITVASLLFGILSYFVYDVKYQQLSDRYDNLRDNYAQLRENIELIKSENELLEAKNDELSLRVNTPLPIQ